MEPTWFAGDLILTRRKKKLFVGDVVVCKLNGIFAVKRISGLGDSYMTVTCDNLSFVKYYETVRVPMRDYLGTVSAAVPMSRRRLEIFWKKITRSLLKSARGSFIYSALAFLRKS